VGYNIQVAEGGLTIQVNKTIFSENISKVRVRAGKSIEGSTW